MHIVHVHVAMLLQNWHAPFFVLSLWRRHECRNENAKITFNMQCNDDQDIELIAYYAILKLIVHFILTVKFITRNILEHRNSRHLYIHYISYNIRKNVPTLSLIISINQTT